jgi:hypothetical protein
VSCLILWVAFPHVLLQLEEHACQQCGHRSHGCLKSVRYICNICDIFYFHCLRINARRPTVSDTTCGFWRHVGWTFVIQREAGEQQSTRCHSPVTAPPLHRHSTATALCPLLPLFCFHSCRCPSFTFATVLYSLLPVSNLR